VNTAYVASSELLERVAHRYNLSWLVATNRRSSLYRIPILNGLMYSGIIVITKASQAILADMYAIGLLASFCINIGCLLIYRYFQGTKEIRDYHTSRAGTLALEVILVACFVYLALHKPYGVALWGGVVAVLLGLGIPLSRRYGPEVKEVRRSDYPMEMLLALGETDGPLDVYFRRPGEVDIVTGSPNAAFVTFFSPRQPIPQKLAPNHYRFPIQGGSVYRSIRAILALLVEELRRPAAAHDVLELGAEVRDQAHALDDDVDDAPGVVLLAQPVVDQHVGVAAAAQDLRLHRPVAVPLVALAHHLDLLVAVALDAAPVGERQVRLEEPHELRLLVGGEPAPVPRQHEARHGVEVEVGAGQVLDAVALLLAREAFVAEHVDGGLGP